MRDEEYDMERSMVTVSKFLAKHLRHAPDAVGLTLQPGGWVSVDDLLAASERTGFTITYDELIECVETNDKKRFSFDDTGGRAQRLFCRPGRPPVGSLLESAFPVGR
jgi:RNA:NAD 2'-phosphotransferase (TPT1/KptA family)